MRTGGATRRVRLPEVGRSDLAVAVRVSGLLPQPVDGVEVFVRPHVGKRLVQEVHQVAGAVDLIVGRGGRGAADPWHRGQRSEVRIHEAVEETKSLTVGSGMETLTRGHETSTRTSIRTSTRTSTPSGNAT